MSELFSSLRTRLVVLVLLAALPALGLTILADLDQRQSAVTTVQVDALQLARLVASEQNVLIESTRQLLAALSHLRAVHNQDVAACQALLADVRQVNPIYANLGVIALDGNVLCSALPASQPVNLADRAYFQRTTETRAFSAGDFQIGRITGMASINFGYPVLDADGRVQAVAFAALDLNWINQQAATLELPPGTTFTMTDQAGIILARYPDAEGWIGQPLPAEGLLEAIIGQPDGGILESEGPDSVARLYAFVPLASSETIAYITLGVPTRIAFAEANRLLMRNLALLALTVAFGWAASWLFSNRFILRQVQVLLNAGERLAAGDVSARATLSGSGELGRLAQAFGRMDASLEQQTRQRELAEVMTRQSAARARALADTAARLNAQLDLDAVLQAVCEEVSQALSVAAVSVCLYRETEQAFVMRADFGLPDEFRRSAKAVPLSFYRSPIDKGESLLVYNDVQATPDFANGGLYARLNIRTVITAIMHRDGRLVGSLNIKTVERPRKFTIEELALLKGIADQAAQAIVNARLFKTAQRRLTRLQALNAIDQTIIARADLANTLNVILEQVVTHLHVDAAGVLLFHEETQVLEPAVALGFKGNHFSHRKLRFGEGHPGRAAQEQRILGVPNLAEADNFVRSPLLDEGFVTYYTAPLITKERVIGVLDVFLRSAFEPDGEWLAFLEAVAAQAAIAIDNISLFSETRRLLQQTEEQARQIQQIIDTMSQGVVLLDVELRLVLTNPAAQAHLPGLLREVEGTVYLGQWPVEAFLQPSSIDTWHELTVPESKQVFEVIIRPIQAGTQVSGWVLVMQDVTEERQVQEYLGAQDRLATVGQLAAGIAHDFNNIMAVIMLYCDTLIRIPDFHKRSQYLTTISKQAKHAANLIGQILDFSRAAVLERGRLDLLPFLKEVSKLLERTLPENIVVTLAAGEGKYMVEADPTRLQQVLMNLAVNARDAMPDGGELHLDLSALTLTADQWRPLPEMEPGPWICLTVADSGSGIADDVLPHIFEPFFTTKQRGRGTGLGLAQVYGIIKQHEGEISVKSEAGAGTTFTIFLPGLQNETTDLRKRGERLLPRAKGEVILLVEDDAYTREAVQDTLTTLGYRVLITETGQEALALFSQRPEVDLVLSDVVMPKMGGVHLYRLLQVQKPEVKCLLMSGYPLVENGKDLLEQEQVAWIQKPFSLDMLARKVRQVLDEQVVGQKKRLITRHRKT